MSPWHVFKTEKQENSSYSFNQWVYICEFESTRAHGDKATMHCGLHTLCSIQSSLKSSLDEQRAHSERLIVKGRVAAVIVEVGIDAIERARQQNNQVLNQERLGGKYKNTL